MDIKWVCDGRVEGAGNSALYGKTGKGPADVQLVISPTQLEVAGVSLLITRNSDVLSHTCHSSTVEALETAARLAPQLVAEWMDTIKISAGQISCNHAWQYLTERRTRTKTKVIRGKRRDVEAWNNHPVSLIHDFNVFTLRPLSARGLDIVISILSKEFDFHPETHAVIERAVTGARIRGEERGDVWETHILAPITNTSRFEYDYRRLLEQRAATRLRGLDIFADE